MIRRHRNLLLVHLPANALLMWLAYEWLGVDESTTGKLLLSAVDSLAILALVCWLWAATLVWFQSKIPTLNESFRTALRTLGSVLLFAIFALILYALTNALASATQPVALKTASWLTWTIRRPVKPTAIASLFTAIFWLLRWTVFPVILIPAAAVIARDGRKGWLTLRFRHPWRHWVAVPLLALAGLQLPFVILNWVPKAPSFALEFASFTLRMGLAYALFLAAMLGLARIESRE